MISRAVLLNKCAKGQSFTGEFQRKIPTVIHVASVLLGLLWTRFDAYVVGTATKKAAMLSSFALWT